MKKDRELKSHDGVYDKRSAGIYGVVAIYQNERTAQKKNEKNEAILGNKKP
jgi:hypothetical protein